MKSITFRHFAPLVLVFLLIFVFHSNATAQTGSYISWNNQVGCINYDSQGEPDNLRKNLILLEEIEDAPCIRVCENSTVTYVMNGTGINNVQWNVSGGAITQISGSNNNTAKVEWGSAGSGAINLTVFYNDNTQREITLCIEKINGPRAQFDIYGEGEENIYCLDTPINFQNLSINNGGSEIVNYFWDFGDGNVSYTFEPTHSYDQPGTYDVTLQVTNNCNCSDRYRMQITIVNKPDISINCPSVVCEGEVHTYSVDDCGGQWRIEGGHIVNQTATTVDVRWDSVDHLGFGFVSYRSECACPFWTTVKVPVVKQHGTIQGDTTLCVGEQGLYTLPQWPTTDFNWTITPGTGANLVYNDQRNQIYVTGVIPGSYILKCDYVNTLLGCTGTASIRIDVLEETEIISHQLDEFCSSSGIKTYTTTSGAVVNWQLTKNNAIVANYMGVTFSYDFTTGGIYTLTATAPGGCGGEPKVISVTQKPATPSGTITGENRICAGVPYDYSFNNTVPNTTLVWEVLPLGAGTFQGDSTGNNVTIVFTSSVTSVRVKRVSLDGLACESGWLNKSVLPNNFNATFTNSNGLTTFCPSSQTSFTANITGGTPDNIEWSFDDENFGNIIGGINSNTVTVSFNEVEGTQYTANLQLKITKCGQVITINHPVTLMQLPSLTLNAPVNICYGSPLSLTLSAPGVTSGTVIWDFGNGVTQNTPFNPSGNYTFPNPYNNSTGSNINQTITATLNNPNGCNYFPQATDTVVVFPSTVISISPGYNYLVCPSDYNEFTLQANAQTGIGMSVNYQWYKNGAPISGQTTDQLLISGPVPQGTYFVKVTDTNGCVVNSQTITVTADCGQPEPCVITPAPNLNVTANWTACGTITAQATYMGTPASVQWIGSPLISLVSSNSTSATFTSNTPGAHLVTAKLTYQTANGPCVVQQTVEVITHYKADFNTIVSCNNGGTGVSYNVTLADNSTVFNVTTPITYNFTGPGIGTNPTGQTYTLTNVAPGTYNYTLTLTMPGKPACTITKQLVLPAAASTAFTVSSNDVCAEEPIYLTVSQYDPANTYRWEFFDTSYIASSATTAIQIDTDITFPYSIVLKVTTPQGCVFISSPQDILVRKANFAGDLQVSPDDNVCAETLPEPTITFVSTGTQTPSTYTWMKGNQEVGTGLSYTPTTSGNYWVKLYDANGCMFTQIAPVNVIIRQRPYAGISGSSNVCSGEQGTITGVVMSNTVQRRWLLNGTPMPAPYGTWATNTPLTINVPVATGTYDYTFEVRPANDIDCGSDATISVTVHAPLYPPQITYNVITCEPYLVEVTASGPSAGTYNWSNGQVGQTIMVGQGGALGVTYTAPSGCSASSSIMVDQPLERSMWVFPVGCFDVCYNTIPAPYILGPQGMFDAYKWWRNGNVIASGGNSNIPPLNITQGGAYQLTIQQGNCNLESGIMSLVPNQEECDIVACPFKSDVKEGSWLENGVYMLDGYIHNTSGSPITVTITSFNNYGVFVPGSVTLPPNTTFNFNSLQFIPNANFNGGQDFVVLQMQGCMTVYPVYFEQTGEGFAAMAGRPAALSVVPNPAEEFTVISYDLGDKYQQAESLTVYNLLGNAVYSAKLDKPVGEVQLATAALPSGTYIVSIQADGVRAIQQALVKK